MKNINKIKKSLIAGMATGIASVLLSTGAFAQTTINVGPGQTYTTMTAAINAVNGGTLTLPITVNVSAGAEFTENVPAITLSGTDNDNRVTFKKFGSGANPVIKPSGSGGASDFGMGISGASYVTIDGIDITIVSGTAVEYGFFVTTSGSGNSWKASQNNIIKNSTVTLSRSNTASIGINQTSGKNTALNSGNIYESITIQNVYAGISLVGNGVEVGNIIRNVTIGSTSANDIGNGTALTYGIKLTNQSGVTIEKSIIRNITATNTANTGTVRGIEFTTAAGSNLIRNNVIYNLNSSVSQTATTMGVVGMLIAGSGGSFNIDYNSVSIAPTNTASSNAAIQFTSVASVNTLRNNIFSNTTAAQTGTARHYAIILPGTVIGAAGSSSNNNDLYVANGNGFVGRTNTTDRISITDWRGFVDYQTGGTDADLLSISQAPSFISNTDLVLDASVTNNWYFNGTGVQVATITTDINGNAIPATVAAGAPDMGAYAFTPSTTPPAMTMSPGTITAGQTNTFTFAGKTIASITWANGSTVPTSLNMYYFSGSDLLAGQSNSYEYFNSYLQVDATGTGPYNYSITFNYTDAEKGNVQGTPQLIKTVNVDEDEWSVLSTTAGANSLTATGLTSFSRFTGTGSITPLPVNLVDFTVARKNETAVSLNWNTLGEINNDRFEIERSKDGINFITVGTVFGNGTTTEEKAYNFEDQITSATNPVLYYRLKQVDHNGAFEYSEIKKLVSTVAIADMKAWYNQTEEKVQLSTISNTAEAVTITVIDIQGRVVAQQNAQLTKGSNAVNLNLQNMPKGIYTLVVTSQEGTVNVNKIMKY